MTFIVTAFYEGTDRMFGVQRYELDTWDCEIIYPLLERKPLTGGFKYEIGCAVFKKGAFRTEAGVVIRSDFKDKMLDVDVYTRDFGPSIKPRGKYTAYKEVIFHNLKVDQVSPGLEIGFIANDAKGVIRELTPSRIMKLFLVSEHPHRRALCELKERQ
jgi:hypothetical protein